MYELDTKQIISNRVSQIYCIYTNIFCIYIYIYIDELISNLILIKVYIKFII